MSSTTALHRLDPSRPLYLSVCSSTRGRLIIIVFVVWSFFAIKTAHIVTTFRATGVGIPPSAALTTSGAHPNRRRSFDNERSADVTFEGATSFLSLLRQSHKQKKANPLPHCERNSTQFQIGREIRRFNRAIQVDWIGRNISSVEPTWGVSNTSSCQFAALAFPPTDAALERALQQKTYVSSFYTARQCGYGVEGGLRWNADKPVTCSGINYGGVVGSITKEECIRESADGYPINLWLNKNSNDALLQCLKQFFQYNENFTEWFDMKALEEAATNLTSRNDILFDRMMKVMSHFGAGGFGKKGDWNTILFNAWARAVLEGLGKENNKTDVKAVARLLDVLTNGTKPPITTCIDDLIPLPTNVTSAKNRRFWRERGLHLTVSKMSDSPSSLLRLFPGSLGGVLPPPPTAVYSVNAVCSQIVNVPLESYFPGCTQYWASISNDKSALGAFVDAGKQNGSSFTNLTGTPHLLREDMLRSCSDHESRCPFPTYDLVIDVYQAYCTGFFHWAIEIWPRIAPFLGSLLADDMPKFAIRIGCEVNEMHTQFYDLFGLNSSKIELIGEETVFAKEIIVPPEGFAHSSLFNYWNLVSVRSHVEQRLGPIQHPGQKKKVLVIVRDASRRGDGHLYDEQFLKKLSAGLPNYDVTPFRSSDTALMSCLECQVREFMSADVVIGSHGAGLSLILFAKNGGTVLERLVDGQGSVIYAELSFLMGLKYFPMEDKASAEAYLDTILFANSY